jgi:hypothetical protein
MTYMLIKDEARIAEEWEKYKGYTVRPLPSTVAYYRSQIKRQSHNTRFMMYGGTPEIRTLFQESGNNVLMVDASSKIVRAMGLLTRDHVDIAKNETFMEADWLKMNAMRQSQFDFLIGDDVINMLAWDSFDLFLRNAAALLECHGLFVCHLLVQPDEEFINKNFHEVINEYRSGIIKSKYDLASSLNFICYDKLTHRMSWQQTIKKITKDRLSTLIPDFDYVKIFGLCNSQFTCPPQNDFEDLVNRYFSIEEIFYPHEHEYCMFEPVYLLKKKDTQ